MTLIFAKEYFIGKKCDYELYSLLLAFYWSANSHHFQRASTLDSLRGQRGDTLSTKKNCKEYICWSQYKELSSLCISTNCHDVKLSSGSRHRWEVPEANWQLMGFRSRVSSEYHQSPNDLMNIFLLGYLHKLKIKIPLNLSLDELHSILKKSQEGKYSPQLRDAFYLGWTSSDDLFMKMYKSK